MSICICYSKLKKGKFMFYHFGKSVNYEQTPEYKTRYITWKLR